MRFSVAQLLTVLLVIALAMGLIVNHRRNAREIAAYQARIDAQERLQSPFERALCLEELSVGDSVSELPMYQLLVDRVYTSSDADFGAYAKYISEHVEGAPASLGGCELHEFDFDSADGTHGITYLVIVREDRCVFASWIQMILRPV